MMNLMPRLPVVSAEPVGAVLARDKSTSIYPESHPALSRASTAPTGDCISVDFSGAIS